jgi:hypothetical protein
MMKKWQIILILEIKRNSKKTTEYEKCLRLKRGLSDKGPIF